jgi:hypothetical protein
MANFSLSPIESSPHGSELYREAHESCSEELEIWDSLKQAITTSSGFERWKIEHRVDSHSTPLNLDDLVMRYLRETLETLAY